MKRLAGNLRLVSTYISKYLSYATAAAAQDEQSIASSRAAVVCR